MKNPEDREIWLPAAGWGEVWRVSNRGRIASVDRVLRNGSGIYVRHGRILRGALQNRGYLYVCTPQGHKPKNILVHRLVALSFIPNPRSLPVVNHLDGNKLNNAVSNLEWCSIAENNSHAHRAGLCAPSRVGPGEASPAHKLRAEYIPTIRAMHRNGLSFRKIAAHYGVVAGTIGHIIEGRTWVNEGVEILDNPLDDTEGWR